MKKVSSIIWGLVLVALGVILGGNALGWFNINVFFNGWWTLFIIIPCTIGLITEKDRTGSFIGLVIGIILLLGCQNVISFSTIGKLILPIIVVIIGLCMIFKNLFSKKFNKEIKELNKKLNENDEINAAFSGQNINFAGEEFKGKTLNAIFGGIKLDLRKAKIKDDVVINANAIFGGIDIIVPDNVIVKTKSTSFFGGVSNKKTDAGKGPIVYVNGVGIFGGVEVK